MTGAADGLAESAAPFAGTYIGTANVAGNLVNEVHNHGPTLDFASFLKMAEDQFGYLSPEKTKLLQDQLARTQSDLEHLRRIDRDWRAEVDAAIEAFNRSDITEAKAAFARIDALIAERRARLRAEEIELRLEEARSKHAQATLFHPFEASLAEPLLTQAAELAETNVWYWVECGRVRVQLGNLSHALAAFRNAERLSRTSGGERELGATLSNIGDVFFAMGERPAAREVFVESLNIARALSDCEPDNANLARDVSVSLNKLGDVLRASGDLPAALIAYEESFRIRRDYAKCQPFQVERIRDLFVSLNKLGDIELDMGDPLAAQKKYVDALDLAKHVAACYPCNAEWARDVSVGLGKVGRTLLLTGHLPSARKAFTEGLSIAQELADDDPSNAGLARDVSVSLNLLAELAVEEGDINAARAACAKALEIRRQLVDRDPLNANWARDVWLSLGNLACLDPANATRLWAEAVTRMEDMAARGILQPTDRPHLEAARRSLTAAQGG